MDERIKIRDVQTLADDWGVLKKTIYDYRRQDGTWETHRRETYDRGNGATVLLYNRQAGTVILTRQFRFPTYVNGHHGMMIEAVGGLLEEDDPEECIKREAQEETGYEVKDPVKIFDVYMSPGSVTERVSFFIAEYEPGSGTEHGGGVEEEDIEVLEIPLTEALAMIGRGEIVDGKTIILLQYAGLHLEEFVLHMSE